MSDKITQEDFSEFGDLVTVTPEGRVIVDICGTADNADWIRAARLLRKAQAGDKEAAAQLEEMENTPMYEMDM
jgi:hypothetical protein